MNGEEDEDTLDRGSGEGGCNKEDDANTHKNTEVFHRIPLRVLGKCWCFKKVY